MASPSVLPTGRCAADLIISGLAVDFDALSRAALSGTALSLAKLTAPRSGRLISVQSASANDGIDATAC
eukprot:6102526-Pleurochrysis_carterae.AAC.1